MNYIFSIFLFFITLNTFAHQSADGFLILQVKETKIESSIEISINDISYISQKILNLGIIDHDASDKINTKIDNISQYIASNILISADGKNCNIKYLNYTPSIRSNGIYFKFDYEFDCNRKIYDLKVVSNLFFDLDTNHKSYLNLINNTKSSSYILDSYKKEINITIDDFNYFLNFKDYLVSGIFHILIGFDHILFLISLLLSSIIIYKNNTIIPHQTFKPCFWDTLKIVTSFTIAHSITLALAALNIINISSSLIESAIALSVAIAALNNIKHFITQKIWVVTFIFGLIHGFGFANVLSEFGLYQQSLLLSLLGFNIGVEIGQLLIVLTVVPLIFYLRYTLIYQKFILIYGSALIFIISLLWLFERAFDVKIIPFI